jgi:hypothetical protein
MRFSFMPKEREIEIEGNKFTVKVGDLATFERLEVPPVDAPDGASTGERMRATVDLMRWQIEAVIGEDGYRLVFGGRPANFLDHVELVKFLTAQVAELEQNVESALIGTAKAPEIVAETTVIDAVPGLDDSIQ